MKEKIAIVLIPGITREEILAELGSDYDIEFVSPDDEMLKPRAPRVFKLEPLPIITQFTAPETRPERRAKERKKRKKICKTQNQYPK